MFAKTEVNGENANPIYKFLTSRCPSVSGEFWAKHYLRYDPIHNNDIRWNFEKILVDGAGQPVARYEPELNPIELVPHIDELLRVNAIMNGVN